MRGRSSPGDTKWMRGNRGPNGHTILTMQAGLWAATTPLNFEDGLVEVVNAGGDTDTNGALRAQFSEPAMEPPLFQCGGLPTSHSATGWRIWQTGWPGCDPIGVCFESVPMPRRRTFCKEYPAAMMVDDQAAKGFSKSMRALVRHSTQTLRLAHTMRDKCTYRAWQNLCRGGLPRTFGRHQDVHLCLSICV